MKHLAFFFHIAALHCHDSVTVPVVTYPICYYCLHGMFNFLLKPVALEDVDDTYIQKEAVAFGVSGWDATRTKIHIVKGECT